MKTPIFFDIETGGLHATGERPSSVLSLSTKSKSVVEEIMAYPTEGSWLSEFSKKSILPQVEKAERTFTEKQTILKFIETLKENEGSPLVGYNIQGFDIPFLQHRATLHGIEKELQAALRNKRQIDIGLRLKMIAASSIQDHIQRGTFTEALGGKTWGQATLAYSGRPDAPLAYRALAQMNSFDSSSPSTSMVRGWKQDQLFGLLFPDDELVKRAHESTADVLMTERLFQAIPSGQIQEKMATPEFAHGWLKTTMEGYNKAIPKDAGNIYHSSLLSRAKHFTQRMSPATKSLIKGGAILAASLGVLSLFTAEKETHAISNFIKDRQDNKKSGQAQEKFKFISSSLEKYGETAGTGHKRLFFEKDFLSEQELTSELGFQPVSIAIPEAGQTSWTSYRHKEMNYHIHEHGEKWVIHEDDHAAATMLMQKADTTVKKASSALSGIPHVLEEGIPGAYYYLKGQLFDSADMLERLEQDISKTYKQQYGKAKKKFQKLQNKFSGKDDKYNTLEGLRHGGQAQKKRIELTDFGSGYRGLINVPQQILEMMDPKKRMFGVVAPTEYMVNVSKKFHSQYAKNMTPELSEKIDKFHFDLLEAKKAGHDRIAMINVDMITEEAKRKNISPMQAIKHTIAHERIHHYRSMVQGDKYLSMGVPEQWIEKLTKENYNNGNKVSYAEEYMANIEAYSRYPEKHIIPQNLEFLQKISFKGHIREARYKNERIKEQGRYVFKDRVRRFRNKEKISMSGNDDEHNTIEGLGHSGVARIGRKIRTPFGSGIDSLKNLLQGAETLTDMVKTKGFQESLKSSVQGRELGAGAFGKVYEMTSTFRGQEFKFARKIGDVGPREVEMMEKFQHDFAPNVYNSGKDKFERDFIDMELLEGTTLANTPNKETFVERVKEKLGIMHEAGYSHLDPHASNVFIGKEGHIGIIDYGASGNLGETAMLARGSTEFYLQGRKGLRTPEMDIKVLEESLSNIKDSNSPIVSIKSVAARPKAKRLAAQQKKVIRSQMNMSASKQMSINSATGGKKSNM